MLKSYFILAWRNLLKNKTSTLINIFGLSIAIGCSLVSYTFVYREYNKEWFHENADRIFLVDHKATAEGKTELFGTTPPALGPTLLADFPQLESIVRVFRGSGDIKHHNDTIREYITFADPDFLKLFTFPLKSGHLDAQEIHTGAVIDERTAIRYFGNENPVGQSLNLRIKDRDISVIINAVAFNNTNSGSHARFRILLPYAMRPGENAIDNWADLDTSTYLLVRDLADADLLTTRLDEYVARHNSTTSSDRMISSFILDHFPHLKLRHRSNPVPQIALIVIALFLLTLSCFNYINIAVATANRRIKEIGIRKVMGSHRRQLVAQFLIENTFICSITLLLGMYLAHVFLLPAFNDIAHKDLTLNLTYNAGLWFYLPTLLLALILISGAYPALYISSFQPISIFGSRIKLGHRSLFTQSLLTFQFVLAFITMIICIGLVTNAKKLETIDWGYNNEHLLVVETNNPAQYSVIYNAALNQPDILHMAGSMHHIGKISSRTTIVINGEKSRVQTFAVTPDYFQTLSLRLKDGVFPSTPDAVIINETFARRHNWTNPLGQTVNASGTNYTISGVVEDFHFRDFRTRIEPTLLRIGGQGQEKYLVMRVKAGAGTHTAQVLSTAWKEAHPNTQFVHYFQDEAFEGMYRETSGIISLFTFVATLALIISCSGLFGLAAQQLASRLKEVCIRKVLGASISNASLIIFQRFLGLLLVAACVAIPVSYSALSTLLDDIYDYRAAIGTMPFLIAFGLILATALLTVSIQLRQLINANPADILRDQ